MDPRKAREALRKQGIYVHESDPILDMAAICDAAMDDTLKVSALTGTDPPSLMKADPADARLLLNECGGARRSNRSRRSSALASFFVRREGRFFAPAYVSDRDARSVGQARSGATRSHAQRPIASMARIASTGP